MKNKNVKPAAKSNKVLDIKATPPVAVQSDTKAATAVKLVPADTASVPMTPEDATKVRVLDQAVVSAKVQLAELEISLAEAEAKKLELINFVKGKAQEMMEQVRTIASSYGIDVNGTSDLRRWNLDTNTMVFSVVPETK